MGICQVEGMGYWEWVWNAVMVWDCVRGGVFEGKEDDGEGGTGVERRREVRAFSVSVPIVFTISSMRFAASRVQTSFLDPHAGHRTYIDSD